MDERAFDERYREWARRSGERFTEASRYIPGGAGSSARTVTFGWRPYPPFMAEGSGSRLRDVDGHSYVDYLLGLGPMILGHRHPAVTRAVTTAVSELGTCFGLPYELEIEAARKVTEAVPGVDLVRFSNSGSEVVGTAVRLARAHTGRPLIIRFEGHYHGWQDTVYWSNHVDPALAGPASRPRVPRRPTTRTTWPRSAPRSTSCGDGLTAAGLVELPAGEDPSRAPVLLPYLSPGEQGALWDPLLRGAVAGLDLSHGREHLARALVNGIVLESRRCLAVLDEIGGFGQAVEAAGSSAADPSFRRDLADATRRAVSRPRDGDTYYSARGAALIAARAVAGDWQGGAFPDGAFPDGAFPDGAFPAEGAAAEPDEARARRWDDLWAAHESVRARLHPAARQPGLE